MLYFNAPVLFWFSFVLKYDNNCDFGSFTRVTNAAQSHRSDLLLIAPFRFQSAQQKIKVRYQMLSTACTVWRMITRDVVFLCRLVQIVTEQTQTNTAGTVMF